MDNKPLNQRSFLKRTTKIIGAALVLTLVISLAVTKFPTFYEKKVDAATNSFRFVVMGDSRGELHGTNEITLRSLMDKVKGQSVQPNFVMFTGDQVFGGADVEFQLIEWKDIINDYYPDNMIYPALGNHEHDETAFSNVFNYLPNEQLPGYQRSAYYFDYGNARFIVMNSDRKKTAVNIQHYPDYIITDEQRNWLENLLATSDKTHHFVMFHVPAYPIGSHHGASLDAHPAERDAVWDVLDKYNVTAVMVGHEHNYNRRKIDSSFNGNGYTFDNTIHQVTLGGAGAPLNNTNKDSRNVEVGPAAKDHYMVVDVVGGQANFQVYDTENNVIDSFTVNRNNKKAGIK
ncbi:MAG: metallophosphoesterase family protein [Bacillota bacterium]